MSALGWERAVVVALAALALVSVAAVAWVAPVLPVVPAGLALAALVSAACLLWWLSDSRSQALPWLCGAAAAVVVGLGSWLDYALVWSDTRMWTVVCHVVALGCVALAGRSGGWVGGLKAALVGQLASAAALLLVFRQGWGDPVQTAVFQASGVLDSYEASGGANFPQWVIGATLTGVLPRTVVALVVGAALGAGTALVTTKKRSA